ncbi:Holliday junction branch migration protein RuvA [Demequina sp.]|uniref:Holliday junction branch migration protein RuvA n=1 Tax=Demequina sp. TaxID=2050685 RepID=UPI003D108F3B
MIAQLTGSVAHVGATSAVIDVNGVGMLVLCTPATLAGIRTGQQVTLHTQLVVREDSLTLFGFATASERDAFETLQSVQGVGPKLALAMLAVHAPDQLAAAVAAGDRSALERVPGVGAKVASRLLLELGGKLVIDATAPTSAGDARGQVVDALVSLGWNAKAAASAVDAVADGPVAEADVASTLRAALQKLGGQRS